jgi:ankyrin repeat protein
MEKELFNIITSQWMDKGKQLIEVKKLLDAGANPHLAIENSYTCIEVASMLEKNDILKVLESSEKMENARIQDIGANIR